MLNIEGKLTLFPRDFRVEVLLDALTPRLGLRKYEEEKGVRYVVRRNTTSRALRIFEWYARKSWKKKELRILWAVIFAAMHRSEQFPSIKLDSIAELAGYGPQICAEVIDKIAKSRRESRIIPGSIEYEIDMTLVHSTLRSFLTEMPSQTEELIMDVLCSGVASSVADLHARLAGYGFSMSAVYKTVEKLKRKGYVNTIRHVKVSRRGPMRELMSPNCRNCFYGYSNEETCCRDVIRQLRDYLRARYGGELTEEQSAALYMSIKTAPFGSRAVRRLLKALELVHQAERMIHDRHVMLMLRKLEDVCKLRMPITALTAQKH